MTSAAHAFADFEGFDLQGFERISANDNGSAGLRIERSSPFDDVADVLAAGNTAAGNDGPDIVVHPFRCNQSKCPTTTLFTTPPEAENAVRSVSSVIDEPRLPT